MSLKILTVDDSKTIRMIVRNAFRPFDCEVIEGDNGVQGLIMVALKPDLILLDVTMPVMNGMEMLRKLRATPETRQIPVMMLTAEGQTDVAREADQLGSRGYLMKPFTNDTLVQRVSAVLRLVRRADIDPVAAT